MNMPNFRSKTFLLSHIQHTLGFYATNVDDPSGGFYQNFKDNGEVYDKQTRHLVSSSRFVFNYARAYLEFNQTVDLERVKSGIDFIRDKHFNPITGGYYWLLDVQGNQVKVLDDHNHCYGLAFVLLAYSWAYRAGIAEAANYIEDTWQLMEQHFWDTQAGLYKDEANSDFSIIDPYRGQNANMHSCEAMIAAYNATQNSKFLDRAYLLADNMINRQAKLADGKIWEHYTIDWQIDWTYNLSDPKNLFRPWGFQPGHHTEWAKLLLMINQSRPNPWLVERATFLFDTAAAVAWDETHGGWYYGFAPDLTICDDEKYFWVQAETFACAALLADATGDDKYWLWYDRTWQYAWQHMIDHEYGAWFRILSADNQKLEDTKSPIGKTDYHTMGACYDVLSVLP
ncbi:AGE family epimerase/isomerase [Paraglaciecola aquimarina]|uniref:AGE family epimerase/isomerase n=1 Tax=Paraglaciecola aquimarina TaxID=1235557 RepID=A0ABU3SWB6_9ALTE|nr:AGE family epimerase/isomerase [Paraglaciecola aquimarina]MDU0354314.1 AGE family epimerase/isomerase [Paraglaciecola aquimarina]